MIDYINYWIAAYFPGDWMAWCSIYLPIAITNVVR